MRGIRRLLAMAVLASATIAGGCAQQASNQDPAALEGVQWTLAASSETQTDLTALGIGAEFDGTRMAGFSGVNSYTGPYEASTDGTFEGGPFAATMMAGPPQAMAAETAYLKLLDAVEEFEIADGKLTLKTGEGKTLTYQATEPFALPGSSWKVTGYNNGKEAVTGPLLSTELTLAFGADGAASGNGGVNTFSGPFESDAESVKIGPLASTKMAGAEDAMAQEQQYLTALQAATEWKVANGVLTMRNAEGATQVVAVPE